MKSASPAKVQIIKDHLHAFALRHFVETGTHKGSTSAAIADLGLNVVTIELSDDLYDRAARRFANQPNVTCLHGDSTELLPVVLAGLSEPALIWLDGHFSGAGTAKGETSTPIIAELQAIHRHHDIPHVVLIDDARDFGKQPDYPSLKELRTLCGELFPGRSFSVAADIIRLTP